jgi:hypothetical protein
MCQIDFNYVSRWAMGVFPLHLRGTEGLLNLMKERYLQERIPDLFEGRADIRGVILFKEELVARQNQVVRGCRVFLHTARRQGSGFSLPLHFPHNRWQ